MERDNTPIWVSVIFILVAVIYYLNDSKIFS